MMQRHGAMEWVTQLDKALDVGQTIRDDPEWGFTYGLVLARLGRVEEASRELERLEGPPPHVLALVLLNAQLGENDEVAGVKLATGSNTMSFKRVEKD